MKQPTRTLSLLAAFCLFTGTSARANETQLLGALTSLQQHVDGTTTLNATQIASHKATIDANKGIFGDSVATIGASFDLVDAYDQNIGPMWMLGTPTANGFNRNNLTNDIHWTVYNVMQNIMDDAFNSTNIQTNASLLDGYKFASADHFPGEVLPPSDPTLTHTATIDGSFLDTFGRDTQQWTVPARQPTGTYLAPGSVATISVPQELVNQGYQIRVGGQSIDLANRPPVQRLERSSLLYDIDSTQIQVANPLGGSIYVEVPYGADAGVIDVDIQNAVRAPFFSMQDHNTTSLSDWLNTERQYDAPWTDFQTEKCMMHVPTSWINNLDDPVTLMQNWDKAIDVTNDLMGFPRDRGKETLFNVVDVVIRANAFSPGYPSVNTTYNPDTNYNGNHGHFLIQGPQFATSFEFHELGHAYLFPKFPGEVESVVNLLHVAVWQKGFDYDWDTAFVASRDFQNNPNRTIDNTAVAWMTSFNFFTRKVEMDQREKNYQLKGYAKFVEVARLFGWETLGDFYQAYNEDEENGVASPTSVDGMLLRMSESVGKDITPLFQFWGIHPDDLEGLQDDLSARGIGASEEVYDLLLHYKDLVPEDNAAFRQFAQGWWGGQPNLSGFWTESEHARQWDTTELFNVVDGLGRTDTQQLPNGEIYTGDSAALIRETIDNLIDTYFQEFLADLNGDGVLDVEDWRLFVAGAHTDLSGVSPARAFRSGDLDGDFDNDIDDFDLFRRAYERTYTEPGAFEAMLARAAVPEPNSLLLVVVGLAGAVSQRCRRTRDDCAAIRSIAHGKDKGNRSSWPMLIAVIAAGLTTAPAPGQVVIYEPFDYPTGRLDGKSGTAELGFDSVWDADRTVNIIDDSLGSQLGSGIGGSIGDLFAGVDRFGGSRAVSSSALSSNGLLDDDTELWFSLVVGYDLGGSVSDSRLAISLGNNGFNSGSFNYWIDDEGSQSGSGVGLTLGTFESQTGGIVATQFQSETAGDGLDGNVFGTREPDNADIYGAGESGLVVGKITWGATSDLIEVYVPDSELDLGGALSSLTVDVDQSTFDTFSFARGDRVVLDELRFGATYNDVLQQPQPLLLQVNTITGAAELLGDDLPTAINYYQVTSASNSLDPSGWLSLSDQDLDGNGPADGSGNGWEEAGGSSSHALSEAYLLGNSVISVSSAISLGNAYDVTIGTKDLVFRYRDSDGSVVEGQVEYLTPGDYNGDGMVDLADYQVWRSTFGSTQLNADGDGDGIVTAADYTIWRDSYDHSASAAAATRVPEPASLLGLVMAATAASLSKRA